MGRNHSAKIQHYIPRFLLRNFSIGKKDHLHVFDKHTGKHFKTSVRNAAAENRFYDFQFQEHMLTLEPSLAELEGKASEVIKKLLDTKNMSALSDEDRAILAVFFSVQLMRTRAQREQWRHLREGLAEEIRRIARNEAPHLIEKYIGPPPDKNQETTDSIRMVQSAPTNFAHHFLTKIWISLQTNRRHPFCIGDHPLGMQNQIKQKFRGNIGLAVEGIEIYFPLTPEYALAMWCRSHDTMLRQGVAKLRYLSRVAPLLVAQQGPDPKFLEQTVAAIDTGQALRYQPENVVNFNSLQIAYAERYLFASTDNFALAKEMIRDNPELRTGPRIRTS